MAKGKNLETLGRQVLLCLMSGENLTAAMLEPMLKVPKRNIGFELSRITNNTVLGKLVKKEDVDGILYYQMLSGKDLGLDTLSEMAIVSFEKYHSGEYSPQLKGTYFKQSRRKESKSDR